MLTITKIGDWLVHLTNDVHEIVRSNTMCIVSVLHVRWVHLPLHVHVAFLVHVVISQHLLNVTHINFALYIASSYSTAYKIS